jgi:hypothetical protein
MPSFTFYFQSPHNLILRSTFSRRYDLRPTTLATIHVNSANQLPPPMTPATFTAALPYSHQSAAPFTPPGLYTIYPPFPQKLPLLGQHCRWSQKPPSKLFYLHTIPHGVIFHKTGTFTSTAV